MADSRLLKVDSLTAGYDKIVGIAAASIEVSSGEAIALLGPNGAGKSTLLRALSGMIKPVMGTIWFDGEDVTGWPSDKRARAGLAHVPEGRRPLPTLTVEENLRLGAFSTRGSELSGLMDSVYERFRRLADRRTQKAGTLSGGEQQMLVIGRAMMSKPRLLLLDEPSLGLSPRLVTEVFDLIADLAQEGLTVLLVEQNVKQGLRIADRGYVLSAGRIATAGTSEELQANEELVMSYLGGFSDEEGAEDFSAMTDSTKKPSDGRESG